MTGVPEYSLFVMVARGVFPRDAEQGPLYEPNPKQCIIIREIPQKHFIHVYCLIFPKWVPFNDPFLFGVLKQPLISGQSFNS